MVVVVVVKVKMITGDEGKTMIDEWYMMTHAPRRMSVLFCEFLFVDR